MTRIIFLFLVGAFVYQPLHAQTVVVSGTIQSYALTGMRTQIVVKEVIRSGYIFPIHDYPVPVSSSGRYRFTLPQTVGTDTTKVRIYINQDDWQGPGDQGVWMNVPHGTSASLGSFTPATFTSQTYPVIAPHLFVNDSTTAAVGRVDTLRFGGGFTLIAPADGGNTWTVINTATVTTATVSDTIDATVVRDQDNQNAGFADGDSVSTQIKLVKDIAAGKGDSDSLSTTTATANAALPKSDTTALHAQKFAVLNDKDAGYADGDSVSIQLAARIATTAASDTVTAAFTQGARGISSASRIYVPDDSIATLSGAINIDCSTGNVFRGTTTGNTTATLTNMVDGQTITIVVTQGASHTFAINNVRWAGGTAPTLTTGANAIDVFTVVQAGGILFGSFVQDLQP